MCQGVLLLLLPFLALAQPPLAEVPPELSCRYGVIGLRAEVLGPDTLVVRGLIPGGPAAQAGLRLDDLIMGAPPYRLGSPEELGRLVQSKAPGDSLGLLVQRQGRLFDLRCAVTDRLHLFDFMGPQVSALPPVPTSHPEGGDALQIALHALLSRNHALPALERLNGALVAEDRAYGADCRLSLVRRALLQPLATPPLLSSLGSAAAETDLTLLLGTVAATLDLTLLAEDPTVARPGDELMAALAPYFAATRLLQPALAGLSPAELDTLRCATPALLRTLATHPSPDLGDVPLDAELRYLLGLAKRVRLAPLLQAAQALVCLKTPQHLRLLSKAARAMPPTATRPEGVEGPLLFARSTAEGWIVVGGQGDNHYRGALALVIDLGGNDTYDLAGQAPVFAGIDYGGDDLYEGPVAAPIAGLSLVVDLQGRDRYRSDWLGQGAAFCGVGLLLDRQGHDTYEAAEYAQGAALFGAGLLLDLAGNDTYTAARHSQGFGGPRAFGLLHDAQGNDRYLVDSRVASSYRDPGSFEGWSQGAGCGVRGYAEGGIGLLLDRGGDDWYQGGDFSQGIGYFFGLGALLDRRGDDQYLGSRYAQGSAAHQAVGLLLDLAGDDTYHTRVAAGQGSAWDAAVGLLLDAAGDDVYRAGELSQGAAAMNGLALLADLNGRDLYHATSGQGAAGSLAYWGGRQAPNLGILMDWAGADGYNLGGRADHMELRTPGIGLFEDR